MLFANKKPEERRRDLKAALESGRIIQMPGAHEPIVARIIEEFDFDGIYISGGALSASLAMPDIGLTTMTEVIQRGRQISRVTDLPSLIDLDTGFGEAMNTARAIQECEESGISGCHIEDQLSPKRCGHLENKTIIETQAMCEKIKAAVDNIFETGDPALISPPLASSDFDIACVIEPMPPLAYPHAPTFPSTSPI